MSPFIIWYWHHRCNFHSC